VKLPRLLAAIFIAISANLFLLSFARAEDVTPLEVTTIVTNGGDDVAYHIPLTVSVVYDGVTYQNVYATTNSVITFGRPDGTYWDYPITPSISIESKDWWVLPQQMPDTHFIINVSEGGFQVDGNYRPYGTFTGDTTSIVITAQIQTDGTVAYTYAVNGPLVGNERTGARLTDGTVVTLEEAGITQVEEAPVLQPEPIEPEPSLDPNSLPPDEPIPDPSENPSPEPTEPLIPEPLPQPEPTPQPMPQPEPTPQPEPEPVEAPVPVEPEPVPLPTPEPEPEPELEPVPTEPEPTPDQEQEPIVEEPVVTETEEESNPSETPIEEPVVEDSVTLDNGVVLTQEQAAAVALLQDPAALLEAIFTNPGAALAALAQVGVDMSDEVREKSEKVIISAVLAGNIATTAAGAAAYRRKL
jgi:hypothetical protein